MPKCDVCSKSIEWQDGYSLTTTEVTTNEAYWKYGFTHQWSNVRSLDPQGDSLAILVKQQASYETGWLICQSCSEMIIFDKQVAKEYASKKLDPPGSGPASIIEAGFAAANAWKQLFGKSPSSIKLDNLPKTRDEELDNNLVPPSEVIIFASSAVR